MGLGAPSGKGARISQCSTRGEREVCVCLLRHCVICEGRRGNRDRMRWASFALVKRHSRQACPFLMMKTPRNHTHKGTPYGVRVQVMMRSVERTESSGQALSCLGLPFLMVERPSSQTQKGTPYRVGVHADETGIAEEDVIGKEGLQETM